MKWESKYSGDKKWLDILLKVPEIPPPPPPPPPPLDDASFNYTSATYCQSGANPTPTITGLPGGTFSSIPAGLSLNPSTGTINLSTSALGSYTLTYTTNGPFPNMSSITMTITNTTPLTAFSYPGGSFCQSGPNPLPTFVPGANAGIFTPQNGFVHGDLMVLANVNTGEVDVSATTPDQYNVINTIPASGSCPGSADFATITIAAC